MSVKKYDVTVSGHLAENKISAIRNLRVILGYDLVRAKRIIDSMDRGARYVSMMLTDEEYEELYTIGFNVSRALTNKDVTVYRYIERGDTRGKIEAIKDIRRCLYIGLKEAKELIDEMCISGQPISIGKVTQDTVVRLKNKGFDVTGLIIDHFDEDLFTI